MWCDSGVRFSERRSAADGGSHSTEHGPAEGKPTPRVGSSGAEKKAGAVAIADGQSQRPPAGEWYSTQEGVHIFAAAVVETTHFCFVVQWHGGAHQTRGHAARTSWPF